MDCPRCKTALRIEDYRGIEVDRCPQCQGMWLDYGELDQLRTRFWTRTNSRAPWYMDPSEATCPARSAARR